MTSRDWAKTKFCRNCDEKINPTWRVLLCPDCRRMAKVFFAIGALIVGGAVKILTIWGVL